MAEVLLNATTGREDGSRPSRRLRRSGRVPGVVYGKGGDVVAVSIDQAELRAALTTDSGLNALITLDIEGAKHLSIVKDLQRHPVRREVLHVDFLRIDADKEIEVEVPLILTGEAKLVTQAGGMVDQVIHDLTILARPADIPIEIVADVSDLEVGSSLRIVDLDLPAGVVAADDPEATIATGLITRSTKEYLREQQALEEAAELLESELAEGEVGEEGAEESGEGDGGDDTEES